MRSQTQLLKHLEPGWTLEVPGGVVEDPMTGNLRPQPTQTKQVSVNIQQRLLSGQTESGVTAVIDERVAIILPIVDVPPDGVLYSPVGERWNVKSEGMVRRSALRKPVYTVVSVRRAKEGDRRG